MIGSFQPVAVAPTRGVSAKIKPGSGFQHLHNLCLQVVGTVLSDARSACAGGQSKEKLPIQVRFLDMQPIDQSDKRPRHAQVAASIRAAILTGELEPGQQLPSGQDLANFFGVSRVTVLSAIRTLREEGFVRSRGGSGVYVRDQASLPGPEDGEHPLAGTATFLFEMGHLKNLPRAGWLFLGIPRPESVAEHSFRVAVIGLILAAMDGADVGRTTALCLMHDAHETRISDVPSVGRAYVTTASPEAVTAHQTAGMPDEVAKVVQELTAEYEATETLESRLAHDADKIETLLQAIEYQAQGYAAEPWRETSLAALRTDAGRQLAQAIGSTDSRWWAPFAASYAELRASTRARKEPR
jgi:putative hydrolases of HD superfamily